MSFDSSGPLRMEASFFRNVFDEESKSSVASFGNSSLFFSTNPSVSYSTVPA